MIPESLQARIRLGDEDAFRLMYGEYSGEIYRSAKAALKDETAARDTVKTVMVSLYREMCDANAPIDTDSKVESLTKAAIAALNAPRHIGDSASSSEKSDASPRHVGTEPAEEKEKSSVGSLFAGIGLVLFVLAGLWSLSGMLMALDVLPTVDLGYSFFDSHIFPLFLLNG